MSGAKGDSSTVWNTLRSLCCSNGWCYGIFWGFDDRNSLLLTLKDVYYEEQVGSLMDSMLLQVHLLGGGVIGRAAFSKNHRWMCLDSSFVRKPQSLEGVEDDSGFHYQSSMGIKTIVVISVEPWGVVQLGSTQEVLESSGFVNRVKLAFQELCGGCKLEMSDEPSPSLSDAHFFNLGAQFGSLLSCDVPSGASDCFMEASYLPCAPSQSFPPNFDHQTANSQLDQFFQDPFCLFDPLPQTTTWSHGLPQNDCMSSCLNAVGIPSLQDATNTRNSDVLSYPMAKNAEIPSGLLTLDELFPETGDHLGKPCPMNDALCNDLIPLSKLCGHGSPPNITEYRPTNSMQSSVTDVVNEDKFYGVTGFDRLLNDLGRDHGCDKPRSWNETLFDANVSEKNIGSKVGASNSLFSRLGLDQLLDGSSRRSSSFAKSMFEDGSSSADKRRKVDSYSCSQNTPVELKSETSNKESGSCVDESMRAGNTGSSRKQTEPANTGKKKARPGTRPKPKDRQMIQDRLAELRGLIPNGEKMSIDRLLEGTIRHLNFMSSLAKHSECVKQVYETRSGAVQKDEDGGVTWACEVGGESMVCPLIIEDLSTPSQMLIEILYDESGFFLEIVDVIRSYGLTILKGVMEVRDTKISARFIVEAKGNRSGMRHEIFSSLIQLLQMAAGGNRSHAAEPFGNCISPSMPLFSNCQSAVPFPVNLADAIQCANL